MQLPKIAAAKKIAGSQKIAAAKKLQLQFSGGYL
jgi:hypothetical protein